jgi:hypothetical protein
MKTNKKLEGFVGFKCTKEELEKLKLAAEKENRNISNYIKTKLFR